MEKILARCQDVSSINRHSRAVSLPGNAVAILDGGAVSRTRLIRGRRWFAAEAGYWFSDNR